MAFRDETRIVRVTIYGIEALGQKDLEISTAIPEIEWSELRWRSPDIADACAMGDYLKAQERRERYVDLLSAQIAASLVDALTKGQGYR